MMRDPRLSVLLLFAVSIFALFTSPSSSRDMKLYMLNCRNHELQQVQKIINGATSSKDESNVARRILRGIGSSPPRCASKCGKCRPCRPVHVPVPPGTPVTAEYYPEAWKCKCGNRLYTP
ncbi:EPIDERMAL PATTERNING FACTOR-like protein 6 [Chenopodium quinoa]|uniref:Epidermal patterning factor-like protein n=1 Tax=Chenopodium quinoa TaxID=63459 RepID=A0A803MW54_CHEQI|nr:EPIDERMAL PATTERNING FACTOR-like protein 6 [Chenopodium quinoa]XP_021770418.1 EPIDERMAL PATTERNING FACTOR-like protein 6 [Chenopodium quinoa]